MRLRSELSLGLGMLLALQLLTAFAAIGLLSRVSPAVAQIIDENVYSSEAVEEMLAVLASAPGASSAERFQGARQRAASNITEEDERPLLDQIEQAAEGALAGDAAARKSAVAALRELGRVNRASMEEQDLQAQRIGITGAWAAALLGSVAALLGAMIYRRLRSRLEEPLLELDAALEAHRSGDPLRRCVTVDAPVEVTRIARNVNWTLDHIHAPGGAAIPDEHAVVLALLDHLSRPAVLLEGDRVVAANTGALDQIAEGVDPERDDGWQQQPVTGTALILCFGPLPQRR